MDHLVTMQCSARKPLVLTFLWMFFDRHHPHTPTWRHHSLLTVGKMCIISVLIHCFTLLDVQLKQNAATIRGLLHVADGCDHSVGDNIVSVLVSSGTTTTRGSSTRLKERGSPTSSTSTNWCWSTTPSSTWALVRTHSQFYCKSNNDMFGTDESDTDE